MLDGDGLEGGGEVGAAQRKLVRAQGRLGAVGHLTLGDFPHLCSGCSGALPFDATRPSADVTRLSTQKWAGPGWAKGGGSTLLQVLVSIQGLIFVDKPYFNEPGFEGEADTPRGIASSDEYNRDICYSTLQVARISCAAR